MRYRIKSVVIVLIRGKSRLNSETFQFTPWNMIIQSTSVSSEWPLVLSFHSQPLCYTNFSLTYDCYIFHEYYSSSLYNYPKNNRWKTKYFKMSRGLVSSFRSWKPTFICPVSSEHPDISANLAPSAHIWSGDIYQTIVLRWSTAIVFC
jgi:hypothetical protein